MQMVRRWLVPVKSLVDYVRRARWVSYLAGAATVVGVVLNFWKELLPALALWDAAVANPSGRLAIQLGLVLLLGALLAVVVVLNGVHVSRVEEERQQEEARVQGRLDEERKAIASRLDRCEASFRLVGHSLQLAEAERRLFELADVFDSRWAELNSRLRPGQAPVGLMEVRGPLLGEGHLVSELGRVGRLVDLSGEALRRSFTAEELSAAAACEEFVQVEARGAYRMTVLRTAQIRDFIEKARAEFEVRQRVCRNAMLSGDFSQALV